MKKILLLFALTIVFACSNDDDNNSQDIDTWRLTQYQAGFLLVDNFGVNDVIWAFNFDTNVLTVTNNVSNTYPSLVPSGNYDFTFTNNVISFTSNSINYESDYEITNDTVLDLYFDIIPQAVDDEQAYDFELVE